MDKKEQEIMSGITFSNMKKAKKAEEVVRELQRKMAELEERLRIVEQELDHQIEKES